MQKYVCELSLRTRSTALVVIEADRLPTEDDLREAYDRYDGADWFPDCEYAEEGYHSVLGAVEDNQFPGIRDIEKLPAYRLSKTDVD